MLRHQIHPRVALSGELAFQMTDDARRQVLSACGGIDVDKGDPRSERGAGEIVAFGNRAKAENAAVFKGKVKRGVLSVGRLKAVLRQQFGKVPVCAPFDLPQIGLRGFGLGELAVFGEVYVILLRLAFVCAGFYSEKI